MVQTIFGSHRSWRYFLEERVEPFFDLHSFPCNLYMAFYATQDAPNYPQELDDILKVVGIAKPHWLLLF